MFGGVGITFFELVHRCHWQGLTHGRKAANFLMQPTANRAHCFRGVESGAVASHTIFVRVEPCSRTSASIFLALVVFHMGEGHIGYDHRGKPWTATRFVYVWMTLVFGMTFFEAVHRCHWQGLTHGRKAANFLMQPTANRAHCFRGVESGAVASHTIFVRVEPCSRTSASIFLALVVFHMGEGHIGCDHRGKPWTATRFVYVWRQLCGMTFFELAHRCHWQGLTHGRKAANFLMQPTANRAHCFRGVESGVVASHTIFVRVEPCSRTSASIFLALVVFHMGEGHIGCDHRGKPWTATRFVYVWMALVLA